MTILLLILHKKIYIGQKNNSLKYLVKVVTLQLGEREYIGLITQKVYNLK